MATTENKSYFFSIHHQNKTYHSPFKLFTHGYRFGQVLWHEDHCRTSPLCFNWHLCFLRPEHRAGRSEKSQWNMPELSMDSKGTGVRVHSINSWLVTKYTSGRAKMESTNLKNPSWRWARLKNQAEWKNKGNGALDFV